MYAGTQALIDLDIRLIDEVYALNIQDEEVEIDYAASLIQNVRYGEVTQFDVVDIDDADYLRVDQADAITAYVRADFAEYLQGVADYAKARAEWGW